jgi:hypothetical protein
MQAIRNDQKGAVAILFAIMLIIIIGFAALAIDVGAWFVARAELSKSIDAAALAGAKNISNPYVDPLLLAEEVARENFPAGSVWTVGAPTFNVSREDFRIRVDGSAISDSYLARVLGINEVVARNRAVAKKNAVEIMLVLDRSGSMAGTPMRDLKTAAQSFIAFFEETQEQDLVGLISFATSVTVNVGLQNNFVTAMTTAINAMNATGATNAEDALDQSDGPSGFTDQSGLPGDQIVQQFLIFFSDGNPTAFRGRFRYNDVDNINAVVCGTGQTCDTVYQRLGSPSSETWLRLSGDYINPEHTGDGRRPTVSACGRSLNDPPTTRWYVFSEYPVPGYTNPLYCHIPHGSGQALPRYICRTARQMALEHAQELKDKNIKIYTIGLGDIDQDFLGQVASGPSYEYYTPDSSELQTIFNTIAKEIKLRLVQ